MIKICLATLVLGCLFFSCQDNSKPRILVFSKTMGYRHASIQAGKQAILRLAGSNNFEADTTEDASAFREDNLKKYRAVIFLNTTGDVLDHYQQADFQRYIQAGGGFMGMHAAADTEYDWAWYGKLVGAYFTSHPKIQEAQLKKVKPSELTKNLPQTWTRTDEWYNYKSISDDLDVLYNLEESSYQGGQNGQVHPIAWTHGFDGGRAFYTGMGHTLEDFSDSLYLDHILQGIKYAMGDKTRLDYSVAKTRRVPEENRFTKVVLGYFLDEPTEMDILPDGRIIFLERKGIVKLYDPKYDSIRVINTVTVYKNFEDGMIGLTHDPDFSANKFLYIFRSIPDRPANVLSRFVFDGEKIDMASEKEMLEVVVQRESCCHTGGSLAFGPDGNLFISTGDNTSPFESDGYSPSDERPGRGPFDAQKSSANTNDLRGKILRIHPEPDGTYTIPKGNLFPVGEPKTRPEIYVMGTRNPYRISVDQRTGFLYWGEVGPDAGNNDSIRGPRGYDEVNQAKKPGFFGWPYFVGNNFAYSEHDFATKKTGLRHDPAKPVNNSPHSTGKLDLPPANPAFVWYPYAASTDFPLVKTGGRNAMAGPVYYSENYKGVDGAFPDYFDGKLIIYDWMRNWIILVTMDEQGNLKEMVPFLENTGFNNIIDMAFGPDGKLYTLEYGTVWFRQNSDARLSRIDFNPGNRNPRAMLTADKTSGSVPLRVSFSGKQSVDPDGDKLHYRLEYGDQKLDSDDGEFNVVFGRSGMYHPRLTVIDAHGNKASMDVTVVAGNALPEIELRFSDQAEYVTPNSMLKYKVVVNDQEDGSTESGTIPAAKVTITFDYLAQGYDLTGIAQGHQRPEMPGKALMAASDCKSCHLIDAKSAGPGYAEIARKYKDQPGAMDLLSKKIINGGSGTWGETAMSAHPQISKENALQIVDYILSLSITQKTKSLPLDGVLKTGKESKGTYLLTASYEDKGGSGLPSLYLVKTAVFKIRDK